MLNVYVRNLTIVLNDDDIHVVSLVDMLTINSYRLTSMEKDAVLQHIDHRYHVVLHDKDYQHISL